jgi:hypothetical protein
MLAASHKGNRSAASFHIGIDAECSFLPLPNLNADEYIILARANLRVSAVAN